MDFENQFPEWENQGTEPSTNLKNTGFQGGYKPPASVFNWFWSKVMKAVTELQTKLTEVDGKIPTSGGTPVVNAYSSDGILYRVTLPNIDKPTNGTEITIIPNMTSQTNEVKLNINSGAYYPIRLSVNGIVTDTDGWVPLSVNWLNAEIPVTIRFEAKNAQWRTVGFSVTDANSLTGKVPAYRGGTGKSTVAANNFLVGSGNSSALTEITPPQVLDKIGAANNTLSNVSDEDFKSKVEKTVGTGVPIVPASSTDGANYTATFGGISALTNGLEITIIPNKTSTNKTVYLNLNGLGAKRILLPVNGINTGGTGWAPMVEDWITAYVPLTIRYISNYDQWQTVDFSRTAGESLSSSVPVERGGTGKTSVTSGSVLVGNGINAMAEKTPEELFEAVLENGKLPNSYFADRDSDVISTGAFSHVEGKTTTASGDYSHAEGQNTKAIGTCSHAEGCNSTAEGDYSHAGGFETTASGLSSYAEGSRNVAGGNYSHAQNADNSASGNWSHAEGQLTVAQGDNSHAEGYKTHTIGSASHAEGMNVEANGAASHAEGTRTEANGSDSHAEGRYSVAEGEYSHAEGLSAKSNGDGSHAEGYNTQALNSYAHAEGNETQANGIAAHSEGGWANANGHYSHAEGLGTQASAYQHVQGKFNKISDGPENQSSMIGDIFIIGNGTSETARSNALRTTTAGKTYGLDAFSGSGADYAEYFEWLDGNPNKEDRRGLFVTLDGDKIKPAAADDKYILGVVSATPVIEGDSQSEIWHGMYMTDVFGCKLTETVHVEEATDEITGEVIPEHDETRWVLNPEYDPEQDYVRREERPEWSPIGMMGKLVVKDDGSCQVNGYCKPGENGIALNSENGYRVIARLDDSHVRIILK